jgi:murein DD-endopeptidase MepM/ murein hydrolase activator NlpD
MVQITDSWGNLARNHHSHGGEVMKNNNPRTCFAAGAVAALLLCVPAVTECHEQTPPPVPGAEPAESRGARATPRPNPLRYFPVRGKHNTGYDSSAGNSGSWACGNHKSNSDFSRKHRGIDIWAAKGTPVVATMSGTVTQAEFDNYGGNRVTIGDRSGWSHYFAHMDKLAPGLKKGQKIEAGVVIGYVGKSGTSSNGVVHLHFSMYPGNNYEKGTNPYPYLKQVEYNVCTLPDHGNHPSGN